MNTRFIKFLKDSSVLIISQLIVLILGIVKSLLLPKILPINEYAFWQVYILYSSYVGVFSLGFNEGIYLKYGGLDYIELPYKKIRSGIMIHVIISLIFTSLFLFASLIFLESDRLIVFIVIAGNIFIMGLNGIFSYIYQITGRIKEYALISSIGPLMLLVFIILMQYTGYQSYFLLICIDLISKLFVVVIYLLGLRKLVIGELSKSSGKSEYIDNIKSGFKIMIGMLSGMLITGISRIVIDIMGSTDDFAFYSFAINITNLVIVLISTVSLSIYPVLKRTNEKEYPKIYSLVSEFVNIVILAIPLLYLSAQFIVNNFLVAYSDSLLYLSVLFSVVMLQTKIQVQLNTFYKSLRKESRFLKDNIMVLIIYGVIAFSLYYFFRNIMMITIAMLIVFLIRAYLSDKFIRKVLHLKISKNDFFIFYPILFLLTTTYFSSITVLILCSLFLLIHLVLNYKKILKVLFRYRKSEEVQ